MRFIEKPVLGGGIAACPKLVIICVTDGPLLIVSPK